jgi:PAS domain S-box-containing protein
MGNKFFNSSLVTTPDQAVEFIGGILEAATEYSIIGKDLNGTVLLWNEGASRLYGYEPEEVVGKSSADILHTPEDVAAGKPRLMLEAALATGHWEGTVARVRKDGSRFRARVVLTLRRDGEGQPVGFLLMSKDVSRDTDAHLRDAPFDSTIVGTNELAQTLTQLALQRTALDTAAAILITDASGVIVWVNPAFTSTTGYSADEAIGQTPRILKSDQHSKDFYAAFWKHIRSGRTWKGEFINRRKDGSIYYDEHTVTPVLGDDGSVTHFVTIMNDVTERKAAEEKLREAHRQMRDLLAQSPAVLYALHLEGGTFVPHLASENVTRLLGFPAAETLTREWWLSRLHPDDREFALASIEETLSAGASRTEYRLQHKDGTYRWVDDNRRLVRDLEGQPLEVAGVWTDITDRKRAQDETRESEGRLRDMLNNLDLLSVMIDREGRVTFCNDYFLRLTGWQREDVIGHNFIDEFVPPEDRPPVRTKFTELLENAPSAWHATNSILTRSGERRLIQWNNSLVRSSSGEAIGVATIGEDVTSRLAAERETRMSEERLRIIVEASTDAIWDWNTETGDVEWSDRAYAMLGYDRATFRPSFASLWPLVHPEDLKVLLETVKDHLEGGKPFRIRTRMRHANGTFVPIFVRGQRRAGTPQMLGVITDLSIIEEAAKQIVEQAALIDQAHDAIVVRDLEDRIMFWNKGAERLYETSSQNAIGRSFHELLQLDATAFEAARERVIADGIWSGELAKVTASGREVVVDCSWTLLRDDRDQPRAIFSIDTDITDRKSLEQQFFRAQRLDSLGTLAGGISHDLNNLLMPILMGVTLLKRMEPDEKSLRAINNIETSARRGADLVKQVLLFARGVEGSRTALDIAAVVREAETILAITFPKNIIFRTDVPATLSRVLGDATQLNQVVVNLCVNARDAMPTGGEITIHVTEVEIDRQHALLRGGTDGGRYVVLNVTDTGSGMTEEVMDRIFEPFFTTKELNNGTGLGLSTARGIVRSHGGFIHVSSEVGHGSTFCVYLPSHLERTRAITPEVPTEEVLRGHGEMILVVDDEPAIRDILRQTLVSFGYAVITAENGAQAVSIYEREQKTIAAIVTDMMMPVMDGHVLIAKLRQMSEHVPIIAMSGQDDRSKLPALASTGPTTFLSKPYSADVMLRTMARVLEEIVVGSSL